MLRAEEKENPSGESKMRLVVIDDDPLLLQNIRLVLSELGYRVATYTDPKRAVEAIRREGADIVITDIMMPECDGFEVLREVKAIDPLCDVIFITGRKQMELAVRALREGAADFFEKPFKLTSLQAALERTTRYRVIAQRQQILVTRLDAALHRLSESRETVALLGRSPSMRAVAEQVTDVAPTSATVLIEGESGTGKELVARAIHAASPLRAQPLVTVNCASIPEDLFESEMFGHRKGAFTGAIESRTGYVQAAEGGTLFLDEIGDLPPRLQPKILRLLEQRQYRQVGETDERSATLRLIAATNQPLEEMVREKRFRGDLYYRLSVCRIALPPLRERVEDIPLLALFFVLHFAEEMGKRLDGISDEALLVLCNYAFPGNVRELRNAIENAVIHCRHTGALQAQDLPETVRARAGRRPDVGTVPAGAAWPFGTIQFEEVERRLYAEALDRTEQNVSAAARLLGVSRGRLRRRLAALGMGEEALAGEPAEPEDDTP